DPFVEWQRVAARAFPTSASIADAVRENPRMVAWHLGYNLTVRMPRAVAGALVPVPSFVPWLRRREALAAAVVLLVLLAALDGASGHRAAARVLVRRSGVWPRRFRLPPRPARRLHRRPRDRRGAHRSRLARATGRPARRTSPPVRVAARGLRVRGERGHARR